MQFFERFANVVETQNTTPTGQIVLTQYFNGTCAIHSNDATDILEQRRRLLFFRVFFGLSLFGLFVVVVALVHTVV